MTTKYLTKAQIVVIHHELIERFGGIHGIRDEALLESAGGRYQSRYYSDEREEAAALMESLGGNHPFIDGNKRIAVTVAFTFLTINGQEVTAEEEAAFEFINGLFETHRFSFANLEVWIRQNTTSRGGRHLPEQGTDNLELPYLEALAQAVENLFATLDETNLLLDRRTTEWASFESIQKKGNPALIVEFCMTWLKTTAADINFASDQLAPHGDDFIKAWATVAQWTENQIPHIQSKDRLEQLSDSFQRMMTATVRIRNQLSQELNRIAATTSDFASLRESVNANPVAARKSSGRRILKMIEDYENAIKRYINSQQSLDEELAIHSDSCDRLLKMISSKLND